MPIFVAGTGRSGTTRLTEILGEHPEVFTFEQEGRFLIDPGGLEDLVRSLTTGYTMFHAYDALDRLEFLLTQRLTGKEENAFIWWDYPREVGPARYHEWVERFLAELTWYVYDEVNDRPDGGPDLHTRRRVARYFPDRSELIALCRRYVDELFSGAAKDRGKRVWCEKTPLNLLSMPFLWELFPEAHIVHIMRHPMAVAASYLDQTWAPDDIDSVCSLLEPIYRRWFDYRDGHPGFDSRYLEVRLEDMTADWPRARAELFQRLGLPDVQTPSRMDAGRAGRELTAGQQRRVRERLGFAIDGMGYGDHPVTAPVGGGISAGAR